MESTPTPRSSVSPATTNDQAPNILDLPIGLDATGMRREFDSLGDVQVPANRYWGAQTQRSLEHFNIGNDRMPKEVYHAYGYVKKAAALVNTRAGRLPAWKGQLVGGTLGSQKPIHPNDHVNMGQSSNDTFPTAMHIAAYMMATQKTIPALKRLREALDEKSKQWADVVKIGRTHLEDAVPLTVGQEWSGYVGALDDAIAEVEHATDGLLKLAMGGTAAVTLFKIANDLRWLGSGPRTGIHELLLPANEPGSSIMPGKVNPTQAEAMLMVCIQIISSDAAVTMGGAEGNFELNAFRPILINNYLHSALILADMCDHFRQFMIEGARLNAPRLQENIARSVMMVTALSPIIGYDQASVISHYAIDHDLTLKQAALANGVSEELFDRVVNPLALTRGGSADLPSEPKEGPK
jgi:fumarate hydratase, class II